MVMHDVARQRTSLFVKLAVWYAKKSPFGRAAIYPWFVVAATVLTYPAIVVLCVVCAAVIPIATSLDLVQIAPPLAYTAAFWPVATLFAFALALWPIKVIQAILTHVRASRSASSKPSDN